MIKAKNNFKGLLGISYIILLILFITSPAEALFGFFEDKEPVDEYSKYIGIDENTLSPEEQNRLKEARENLYHKEKTEFHFISRKYPTLKVFNEFTSSDSEGWIEYATENHKKGDKVSKTDTLADIPQNATDRWIEYLGENKGRSYYKTHNLNQTDFWEMDIPPTKEDTEKMASYDPYKVIKYYPQIEQAYYNTPVWWDKKGINRTNEILNRNYPARIDGFSIKYYKPQSMQKENVEKRATKKFNELFYKTLLYKDLIDDYKFEKDIFKITQQRVGYMYIDHYGGEYYRKFGQWANDWAVAGTGATKGKYVGKAKDVQNFVDTNTNLHYRILTEEDMKFISEIGGKPIVTPTPTPEPTPEPTLAPTPTISPTPEELIRKSALNETISPDLLNETAVANETIAPDNRTLIVDNRTFDFLTGPITPENIQSAFQKEIDYSKFEYPSCPWTPEEIVEEPIVEEPKLPEFKDSTEVFAYIIRTGNYQISSYPKWKLKSRNPDTIILDLRDIKRLQRREYDMYSGKTLLGYNKDKQIIIRETILPTLPVLDKAMKEHREAQHRAATRTFKNRLMINIEYTLRDKGMTNEEIEKYNARKFVKEKIKDMSAYDATKYVHGKEIIADIKEKIQVEEDKEAYIEFLKERNE